jgi:hypothetical protein
MFFGEMWHFILITYLPPTSHLQSYNLPTNPPTYLDVAPPTNPPTYLDVIPTYPPTHPPTYLHITYILFIYVPSYLDVLIMYLLTYLPTHL